MARVYSDEEKAEYLAKYQASGKSKTEFSRENDIPEATFRAWVNNDNRLTYGMIDLKNLDKSQTTRVIKPTIFMSDKIRIELQDGYDKNLLRSVIEVLINDTKVIE